MRPKNFGEHYFGASGTNDTSQLVADALQTLRLAQALYSAKIPLRLLDVLLQADLRGPLGPELVNDAPPHRLPEIGSLWVPRVRWMPDQPPSPSTWRFVTDVRRPPERTEHWVFFVQNGGAGEASRTDWIRWVQKMQSMELLPEALLNDADRPIAQATTTGQRFLELRRPNQDG